MEIRTLKAAQLKPADYNPRRDLQPEDAEYQKLRRSMEEFGYVEPIIWNERTGRVVGGHQRLKVLLEKGAEDPTFGYLQSLVNAFGSGVGFLVAMVLFAGVRERLENCDIPETFKGLPITLVAASLVAVSFLGFNGVVDNLL